LSSRDRVLGSVIVVIFKIIFCAEMYQNKFFKKKLFLRSARQNDPKYIKNFNFLQKKQN